MSADISTALKTWSTTESSNSPSGGALVGGNLDDNLRAIQVAVRALASSASVASAATVDLNAQDTATFLTITGTTTITALGTVSAGIYKWLVFAGALTFTHNGTSLILPTGASITTAAGDVALMLSLGSGNWRCLSYTRADGKPVNTTISVADGTVSAPGLAFDLDLNTGLYRIGADNLGISAGGVKVADMTGTTMTLGSSTATSLTLQTPSNGTGIKLKTYEEDTVEIQDAGSSSVYAIFGRDQCALTPGKNASNVGTTVQIFAGAGGSGSASHLGGGLDLRATAGYHQGCVWISTPQNNRAASPGAGYGLITLSVAGYSEDIGLQVNPRGGMVSVFGTPPTISSGAGTGATIAGNLNGFKLTCGTSASTTIVINVDTGNSEPPVAPYAIANYRNGTTACRVSATSTAQVTITMGSAPSNGDVIDVLLFWPHRETHLS